MNTCIDSGDLCDSGEQRKYIPPHLRGNNNSAEPEGENQAGGQDYQPRENRDYRENYNRSDNREFNNRTDYRNDNRGYIYMKFYFFLFEKTPI